MDADQILSTDEAARELGVTRRRVQAMIAKGQIKAKRIGRDYAIMRDDLDQVRTRNRKGGRPPAPRPEVKPSQAGPAQARELLLEWAARHAGTVDLEDFAPAMAMAGWFASTDQAREISTNQLFVLEAVKNGDGTYSLPGVEVPAAG